MNERAKENRKNLLFLVEFKFFRRFSEACEAHLFKSKPEKIQQSYTSYLFAHCGARRAFLSPNFLRSFARGSRFKNPTRLRRFRKSGLNFMRHLARPWRTASACA